MQNIASMQQTTTAGPLPLTQSKTGTMQSTSCCGSTGQRVDRMPLLNKEKKEEIKKAIGSGDTSKIKEVRKKPPQEELNEQLLEAVEGGVAQKVADALSAGADANARDKDGIPALANAV